MARQRMVKPEFFDSGSLAECSYAARLLFIGLWVMGDDNGNSKLSVRKLKRQVFPFDDMPDSEFGLYMSQLESSGCIKGYEVDGERYVNVPNFSVYQTVNRPSKSTIPEPPKSVGNVKRTTSIREWMNCVGTLTEHSVNSEHSVSTHAKERKKEGKNVVVLQQQRSNGSASDGADADRSAPPSAQDATALPVCPLCSKPVRFDAKDMAWRCEMCGDVKEPSYVGVAS